MPLHPWGTMVHKGGSLGVQGQQFQVIKIKKTEILVIGPDVVQKSLLTNEYFL